MMVGFLIPRSFIIFRSFSFSGNLLKICPNLYTVKTIFFFLVFRFVSCSCTIAMASSYFSLFSINSLFSYFLRSTMDHMLVFLFTLSPQFRTCDKDRIWLLDYYYFYDWGVAVRIKMFINCCFNKSWWE